MQLRLKQVYDLSGTPIDMTWGLRSVWFPEVDNYSEFVSSEAAAEIIKENRLQVRCIFERNYEGDRFADMHTIWFDGKPVMIVRDGGRGGQDFRDRIITDEQTYLEICLYLRQKQRIANQLDEDDVADPETPFYPEEMFDFYGSDNIAESLGYYVEPKTKGYQVFFAEDMYRIVKIAPAGHCLVEAKASVEEMPEYIRRRGYVMQRVRPLTQEELEINPRVLECAREGGYVHHYWYLPVKAPAGVKVVKV